MMIPMGRQSPGPGIGGIGDMQTVNTVLSVAPTAFGTTVATAAALGATWATGTAVAVAVPVVGAVAAGIIFWLNRRGPRQKVAATQIVDEAEKILQQNLEAYRQARTTVSQSVAKDNFEIVWRQVVQACSNPNLGDPGRRCISERDRGGRWDWWRAYYDPIANDQPPMPDVATTAGVMARAEQAAGEIGTGLAQGSPSVLIPLALVAVGGVMLLSGQSGGAR